MSIEKLSKVLAALADIETTMGNEYHSSGPHSFWVDPEGERKMHCGKTAYIMSSGILICGEEDDAGTKVVCPDCAHKVEV